MFCTSKGLHSNRRARVDTAKLPKLRPLPLPWYSQKKENRTERGVEGKKDGREEGREGESGEFKVLCFLSAFYSFLQITPS